MEVEIMSLSFIDQNEDCHLVCWRTLISRKLEFNFFAISVKNTPSKKACDMYLISRGEIGDLDITDGIVRTKILSAWTDATQSTQIHNEGKGINVTDWVKNHLHHGRKHTLINIRWNKRVVTGTKIYRHRKMAWSMLERQSTCSFAIIHRPATAGLKVEW